MRPGTKIRSADDVHRMWVDLMGPDGFGMRTLWVMFLDAEARTMDVIVPIEDLPSRPDPQLVDNLAGILSEVGASAVLLLLSRPGPDPMTGDDRAWAAALLRSVGPMSPWPVHLATHGRVRVFAPDDLMATG